MLLNVILYMHQTCSLCDDAEDLLTGLQAVYDFTIEKRDIKTNDEWHEAYMFSVPVVVIEGKELMHPDLTFSALAAQIEATQTREEQ